MKLTMLYAAAVLLFLSGFPAMAQCPNEMGCDVVYTCGQCHYTSKSCASGCQPSCDGGPCAAFQALSPVERNAIRAKQVLDAIANPARLNDHGMLWQQITHRRSFLNVMSRADGANLPPGHPPIGSAIASKQKCSIAQEAMLVRFDLTKYR